MTPGSPRQSAGIFEVLSVFNAGGLLTQGLVLRPCLHKIIFACRDIGVPGPGLSSGQPGSVRRACVGACALRAARLPVVSHVRAHRAALAPTPRPPLGTRNILVIHSFDVSRDCTKITHFNHSIPFSNLCRPQTGNFLFLQFTLNKKRSESQKCEVLWTSIFGVDQYGYKFA